MSDAARAALANHDWIEDAKALGEQQLQQLKSVGALVEENPKQAALIVRGWLSNAA
jgi:flagellar M-ring protein FliF